METTVRYFQQDGQQDPSFLPLSMLLCHSVCKNVASHQCGSVHEKKFKSLDKVVSQRGFFAQSLFTVLARIWLLTSVVLFMKRMFKSLDKVVSQRGSLAQSLVTVFARMWLLASVVLFMKKMFKSLHKVVSQRGYFAQSLVTVFARTWLLTSVALFMKKIV